MMFLKLLVKILLQVMDLNIAYKTHKTSKNTRNSDFRKMCEIRLRDIFRSSTSYALFFPSTYSLYHITFVYNNLNLPSPVLHTKPTLP